MRRDYLDQEDLGDCDDAYVAELHARLEVPPEFEDYKKVLDMGARKYGPNNWLTHKTPRTTFRAFHDCAFHHLARSFAGVRKDNESGLDHLLHAITNLQMLYVLINRGILEPSDDVA